MKSRLVQAIEVEGNTYGQVSHPDDLMKAEEFLHARISEMVHDFLNNAKQTEVAGFPYELAGGNGFGISIKKPGRVYKQDGLSFELLAETDLTISAADEDLPRLDLVVAVLDDEVEANSSLIPFVRLRTAEEFGDAVPPYPPQNIMAARELHWRSVPQIKTGTPASIPNLPTLNSNEVPLYLIKVAPGAMQISDADVLDIREAILTLRQINDLANKNKIDIRKLAGRVDNVETLVNQPIDLSAVFGSIKSLGDILSSLQLQIDGVRDLPEIRYERPKVTLTDPAAAQLPATGVTDESGIAPVQVVDIEIGGSINFGNTEIFLSPDRFVDPDLFARLIKVADNPETEQLTTNLTINDVEQIASDGAADFVERASNFDASRSRPACAARNGQFVEVFGGLASDNSTSLSDWKTYDVDNDTLDARTPSITLPASDRPLLIPYGNGTDLLLICGNHTTQAPRCFKVNADTMVTTELVDEKPTGDQFFGDLIAPGIMLIVALRKEVGGVVTEFWEFNTLGNEFAQLGTTGSVPSLEIDYAHGCHYDLNQFVLVKYTPKESASGQTYIFDRTTSMWTEINIPGPYGETAAKQSPLSRFRIANINGRPLLIGGLLTHETDFESARIWELRTSRILTSSIRRKEWISWNATFPPVQDAGICSTINAGYATGKAVLLAGQGPFSNSKNHVYASVQGGLIATTYKGEAAITIADNSTFVQFTIPVHTAPWDVSGYLLNIIGSYDSRNLQVDVSFDDGATYHPFKPERFLAVSDSDAPGNRRLRFTLFNLKSSKPVLSRIEEFFDEDGDDLETRAVIRYQPPADFDGALYVHRDGSIRLSATVEPSTPDKCLLHKLTHHIGSPFTVKNFINLRRPRVKYSKVKSGSASSTKFENELAVPVRFVSASVFKADTTLYHIADPSVGFDQEVTVSGVVTNGDTWIVEISG